MSLEPIKYDNRTLKIIDQLLLPQQLIYVDIRNIQDGWDAIKYMKTRGAPAIAVVGALSLAVDLNTRNFTDKRDLQKFVCDGMDFLITARPTAVNIFRACIDIKKEMERLSTESSSSVDDVKEQMICYIEKMLEDDVKDNIALGEHGAKHIIDNNIDNKNIVILTHCNAGALATVGYGTALGVIRSLHKSGKLKHTFCTETRAYNQGARLTAYELVHENIPSTLITDSSVSIAMQKREISAVVVGADRIALNGDTANKIGTYQIAIAAKYHCIPFYIAAPTTTIDMQISSGKEIVIEERNTEEITHYKGERVAASDINCWNPAFDVTEAELITGGIITEFGVFKSTELKERLKEHKVL